MILKETLYSLKDLTIIPSNWSRTDSRDDCKITYLDKMLPLFTAPMSSVIDVHNQEIFHKYGINTLLPRSIPLKQRMEQWKQGWGIAVSFDEFDTYVYGYEFNPLTVGYLCVDIANGHMTKLMYSIDKFRTKYPKVKLIVGNIANPDTYEIFAKLDVWGVRLGIGNGQACTTSVNSGIHFPMASLIEYCYNLKQNNNYSTNIIADGGMENYDDIVKALALGADYVMCGYLFAQTLEAAGPIYDVNDNPIIPNMITLDNGAWYYRNYYGMSTRRGQKEMNCFKERVEEGINVIVKVECTLENWIKEFEHYLKTAMSYCNSIALWEFIGKPTLAPITIVGRESYWK